MNANLRHELDEKNKIIAQMQKSIDEKNEQLSEYREERKSLKAFEFFVGYLLDHKEGEEITEENLQI